MCAPFVAEKIRDGFYEADISLIFPSIGFGLEIYPSVKGSG